MAAKSDLTTVPATPTALKERVQSRLDALGLSALAASTQAGQGESFVRDILRLRVRSPRAAALAELARVLQCSTDYLLGRSEEVGAPPVPAVFIAGTFDTFPLHVRHDVAAGVWLELEDHSQVPPPLSPLRSAPEWPSADQWVARVVGDSMNELYPEGSYVRLVSVFAMQNFQPRTGDHVEVVRKRDGGALRETTLKEVRVNDDGSIDLVCRSNNPRWKDPIPYRDGVKSPDDGAEVMITGLVTGDARIRPVRR
jgi:transcriptional regulator with XRE-family HTH domain